MGDGVIFYCRLWRCEELTAFVLCPLIEILDKRKSFVRFPHLYDCENTMSLLKQNLTRILFTALLTTVTFVGSASSLSAFTGGRAARGPLVFEIAEIEPITEEGKVYEAPLTIENASDVAVTVRAVFSSIDGVYLLDGDSKEVAPLDSFEREFTVGAKAKFEGTVPFLVRGVYRDAHYPIRAVFTFNLNGTSESVDLRPVFATDVKTFLPTSERMRTLVLGKNSYLKLTGSNTVDYFAYWKRLDGDYSPLSVGWSGSEENSACSMNPCYMTRGGVNRAAWSIHPPYKGGPGVIGLRFAVSLPETKKIELRFFRAMRDVFAPEPPTDGVIFRVYASPLGEATEDISQDELSKALAAEPNERDILLNEQYNGAAWSEANVDLSRFAGKNILLTFETDPGAKRDTTCDGSFWGDVAIMADPQDAAIATEEERESLREKNARIFKSFVSDSPTSVPSSGVVLDSVSRGFNLGEGQFAVVSLGKFGVCDGWIAIGSEEKFIQIDGVRVQYRGVNLGFERPLARCDATTEFVENANLEKSARQFAYSRGSEIIGDLPVDANFTERDLDGVKVVPDAPDAIACFISQTTAGLAFRFVAADNEEIENLQFGPMSEKAARVYFGHGHCIVDPKKPFTQDGDGFGCSTSHVGFDFDNGVSLLEATTRPVNKFIVNPDLRVYTLTTCPDSRLTLRVSDKGALDCAIKYAPGFDKKPALLVSKKAGRFVFDYWGGQYATILERMKTFVDYGLTDSLLVQHVWQRYGYDNRLPDIWPPREDQGTLAELKETQKYLDEVGIPFGLHDNYIDFYPDADGFNYDDVIFNPDGLPQKAWYNPGPNAQSYRFNPTKIRPYAERNLNLVSKDLMQTAYFTDVFSSIHIMDFYDRTGKFHSRAETLDAWNKYFDLVHEKFNNNAITISESGNDALIGHLDGADAILRRVTPTQENYSTVIDAADCEYVPWFDAVNHKRFSLHGVGYSERYQGGLSRALRGIESDDYVSSEVLTGHAIMADLSMSIRGTVRKYWLLQNLARSLALAELTDFEFVDNDIHRQKITWSTGDVVYVNRGVDDWTLDAEVPDCFPAPITLPRFGFWTVGADGKSYGGVVRTGEQIAELRVDGDSFFVNGRQKVSHQVVPIRPTYENVRILDRNSLEGDLVWDALQPTDKPYTPFLHLERPQTWWNDKPELHVLPLQAPNKPSDTWRGREAKLFGDKVTVQLPEDLPAGYYNLLCGLYDTKTGRRLQLLGSGTSDSRYRLGSVIVDVSDGKRKIIFEPVEMQSDVDLRLVANRKPTDFGVCETLGAFRLETLQDSDQATVVTPLPEEPPFTVVLKTSAFKNGGVFDVIERDRSGKELNRSSVNAENGTVTVDVDSAKAFSYKLIRRK